MPLLKEVDPNEAADETKKLLDGFQQSLGLVPKMVLLMAHSPAILDAYLHFNHALDRTTLTPRMRALVAVAVAELNGCEYTLATGMRIGRRAGVADAELEAARHGLADDTKTADALAFATSVVRSAGRVPHAEIERLQRRGFSDAEIVDVIGAVGLNLFRNYFNLVVGTGVEAPPARSADATAAAPRSTRG
jgi:uncharacterized peroxidase-related enzyme